MSDPRVVKLADILVNYSLEVRKGERVIINSSSELAKPLAMEVYKKVLKAGGHPTVNIAFEEMANIFYSAASKEQLLDFPKVKMFEAKNADCVVSIRASVNKRAMSNIDPKAISMRSKVLMPIQEEIVNRKRWVICNFPTNALAQETDMSLEEYEDFLYSATNINWDKVKKEEMKLKRVLDKGKLVRIVGKDTDLTIGIKGRKAILCCGKRNMPDGEVFLSPVENSVEGQIYYDLPAIYNGKEVLGIRLKFKKGKVVQASAEKNEEFLLAMLDTDKGARYLGELGIGTNYGIRHLSKDILFDEKIGGTVHLAVGRSYKDAGGKNVSAIHWDMIKDLRSGGAIYVDGRLIQKNGKFIGITN